MNPIVVPERTLIRRVPDRTTAAASAVSEAASLPSVEAPPATAGGRESLCLEAASLAHAETRPASAAACATPGPDVARPPSPGRVVEGKNAREVLPVSADQFRIRLLVEADFARKLDEAASYLSHRFPDRDPRKVLAYGLDLILKEAAKQRDPKAVRARAGRAPDPTDGYIPDALRRLVWERDGGSCVWQTSTGRCGSTYQLEVDHIVAVALGGMTVLENLRLLCSAHNLLHARQDFGRELLDAKIAASRAN